MTLTPREAEIAAMLRAIRESSPRQTSEQAYAQMRASLAASARCNRAELTDGARPSVVR